LLFGRSGNWPNNIDINVNYDLRIQLNDIRGTGKSGFNNQVQLIQESSFEQYFNIINLVNEVVQQRMKADEKPIEERVDFRQLKAYIEIALTNNNLAYPFQYAIADNNRNIINRSQGFEINEPDRVFYQVLFPSDRARLSKIYTLQVVFPTIGKNITNSLKFIIPSILLSLLLLVVFAITLYIILRQKHLSEIKKDFVSNMTHELKTPVSSISIAGQMLSDADMISTLEQTGPLSKSASFKKITRTIADETKRLQFLIDKVLQMSLMEDGHSILKIKELDANDLLLKIAQIFDIQVVKCDGKLELELDASESMIYVDELHFTNVLFNLLENAVKYRKADVPFKLLIRTENVNENILISIKDNGTGIKKDNLKKVFDRFYRVHTGNVHNVKGFGLGLAYVKKIVEELNGTIKVESEMKTGTKFIISLPYAQ
jgi:two-component system phosphate regulon sensor histidine kinase PhoR